MSIIYYFIHKIIYNIEGSQEIAFIICLLGFVMQYINCSFYYGYNTLAFLFIIIAIYYILFKDFSYKNAIFIAIFCSFVILSKHTIGFIFFIFAAISIILKYHKAEKFINKIIIMIITGMIVCSSFLLYLFYFNIYEDFFNICFNGLSGFKSNFMITWLPIIIICILLFLYIFKIIKNKMRLRKNEIILIMMVFCLLFFAYPIFDISHAIPSIIILGILISKYYNIKNKDIICIVFVICLFFIIYLFSFIDNENFVRVNDSQAYNGVLIHKDDLKTINNIENLLEESNNNAYIISKAATMYSNYLDRPCGNYDHLWDNNNGNISSLDFIKALDGQDKYVILVTGDSDSYQWDKNISKYIRDNFTFVDKIDNTELYYCR